MSLCLCLSGSSRVTTKTGGSTRIDELRVGDKVLSLPRRGGGGGKEWTSFLTFLHREPEAEAEFLLLSCSNGRVLRVSEEHLLFTSSGGGKRVGKKGSEVLIGDALWYAGEAEVSTPRVVGISKEKSTGFYAPLTGSGDLLVDGFLVSCYADVGNHERAHAALAPLRTWLKISKNKSRKPAQGIHGYAKNLMKIRAALPAPLKALFI